MVSRVLWLVDLEGMIVRGPRRETHVIRVGYSILPSIAMRGVCLHIKRL